MRYEDYEVKKSMNYLHLIPRDPKIIILSSLLLPRCLPLRSKCLTKTTNH